MSGRTRSSRACAAPGRSRAARTGVSYREPSSDESMDELYIQSPEVQKRRQGSRSSKINSSSAGHRRKREATSEAPSNVSRKRAKKCANGTKSDTTQTYACPKDGGVIPPWSTLPYEILLQIFTHASTPVYDSLFVPTSSVRWLLEVSRICKSFLEPALTALYRSPPLDDPYGLTKLLSAPTASRSINYNSKVQRLEVQVSRILAYSIPGHGHFDLGGLIRLTPQLRDLLLYHEADNPKFGRAGSTSRAGNWTYQDSIFSALEETKIRLRSWIWNTRMVGAKQSVPSLKDIHQKPPFQTLQALTFFNYHPAKRRSKVESSLVDGEHLAATLSVLPRLQQLTFESCSLVESDLLAHLPVSLSSLTFRNCSELTSENFRSFLVTHGRLLKELILDHNQSLSLSFLAGLATSCPRLEVLKMDLLYYNSHFTFRDSEPKYEDLLLPDEVPTWPSSLQVLDLVQLRNWDAATAEMFFESLIDSAIDLPHLRRLVLKAILKIGWRDRASFRDKWIGRLQRVFLRPNDCPIANPRLAGASSTGKENSGLEDSSASGRVTRSIGKDNTRSVTQGSERRVLRRQSSRTSTFSHIEIPKSSNAEDSDSDQPLVPRRRSSRLTRQEEDEYALPVSPASSPPASRRSQRGRQATTASTGLPGGNSSPAFATGGNGDWKEEPEKFIQGMCETVEVRIDNLRPMEEQLNENDFLDEELSGDEDWVGDDTIIGDTAYAW